VNLNGAKEFSFSTNTNETFIVLLTIKLTWPPENSTVVGARSNAAPVMNSYAESTSP
jgi:hypothetical protein